MAKPVCTFCGQFEGILMDTNLADGETQVVCVNDLMMYALSVASGITQGMTIEQAEAYSELLDAIYANDPRGPKPPASAAGRKRRSKPEPDEVPGVAVIGDLDAVALLEPCSQCGGTSAHGDHVKLTCDGCGAVLATADDAQG